MKGAVLKKYKSAVIPYAVYESAMARYSRDKKKMNAALIASVLIASLITSAALMVNNIGWQKHELKMLGK